MTATAFRTLAAALLLLWSAGIMAPALAAPEGTGLPLPRFVNLRAGEVNMRAGPGVQYPVEWVYHRKGLPVEIIAEYHTWRKVRDWQGTNGWVHQSMLSGGRYLIVNGGVRTLRENADTKSAPVARAQPGVIGRLLECPDGTSWCRVEIDGFAGWLRKVEFWGAYPKEVLR